MNLVTSRGLLFEFSSVSKVQKSCRIGANVNLTFLAGGSIL
jgi:hypothetical protein